MLREIQNIAKKVHALQEDERLQESGKLPSKAYFLNEDEIVCFPRDFGDSRYPYSCDGLTLWAYSSGNIKIEESAFNIMLDFENGREPTLGFFYGLKQGKTFFPVSVTGAARQPAETNISRYTVYCPHCVYYIAESPSLLGAVKMYVDTNKNVQMRVFLQNRSNAKQETYLSAFMNCILSHAGFENFENKWYRSCELMKDGFFYRVTEYMGRASCMYHFGKITRDYAGEVCSTTSLADYKGGMNNQLISSVPLRTGKFLANKPYTTFTDIAVAGDMIPLVLGAEEWKTVGYTISVADEESVALRNAKKPAAQPYGELYRDIPVTSFVSDGTLRDEVFGCFVKSVLRQVEFCTRAKNYAGALIGIRDIFQQLECALLWIPDYCKQKIVEALGYIGENGRAPRQYSYPRADGVPPAMDLREYIDQGVWVISTIYRYLAVTGDFSILKEECGYYRFEDGAVSFSNKRDTVLDHLIAIAEYLLSNVDRETNCLHVLYGDWNDALDGLGKTNEIGANFGTGVSVMATMQLYQNLNELCEILLHEGGFEDRVGKYRTSADAILHGLEKYAVDTNGKGDKKIIHGWGDKISYKVGSFCDNDGLSRDSATSNAFWILSGVNRKVAMKEYILNAFKRLGGKYGIKTFEPYFAIDNREAGRITRLPKGTAENGAVYIHASLFAIWALFEVGESQTAWEQLIKILPVTHEFISTTPFVMPNSYVHNEEIGCDGESMSDWFTGSGCVLGKVLFFSLFGVRPNLAGVEICPAVNGSMKEMRTKLKIKGGEIELSYRNIGSGERLFTVNGTGVCGDYDEILDTKKLSLRNEDISGKKLIVCVCD